MKKGWGMKMLGDIIVENKKSAIKVRDSSKEGDYIFFTSGEKTRRFDKYIVEGENLFLATGGKAVINYHNGKAAYSTDAYSIKGLKNCANTQYLYFIILFQIERIESKMFQGAAIKHLQKNEFKKIEIPLPSLSEQKRIVKILDDAFNAIDKAKENIKKNINNSKELFESYLNNIFDNPGEGWMENKLNNLGIIQTGTTPKTSEKENYGNFISFIKPADVDFSGNGDLRYNNGGLSEIGLKKGRIIDENSVLMVCIGATIGKTGFSERKISCNQQINSITFLKEYEPKFFYYLMISKEFQNKVLSEGKGSQATLPIINKSKWGNLTVVFLKSKKEQKEIVLKLDELREQTKKLEKNYQKKLEDLEEMKKSILQKAFNGEL